VLSSPDSYFDIVNAAPVASGDLESARVADFVGRTYAVDGRAVELHIRPLHGGLEASGIARVDAHFRDSQGRARASTFVVKQLDGPARREADLYGVLSGPAATLAPRLLGVEAVSPERVYLYLEYVRATRVWPWRQLAPTGDVLKGLAAVHANVADAATGTLLMSWDYEGELRQRALWTLAMFEQASVTATVVSRLRSYGAALRRLVLDLPRLRSELLAAAPFGSTVLHGDVHSRNVLLRARQGAESPVLIDWGRARIGSPLEDVSSWLHSLGCWEPEVRRRHDTLVQAYLAARGFSTTLLPTVREAYWLAAASNSLSGALGYQLWVAMDTTGRSERERLAAAAAVRHHLRVIRRADALWRA